MKKVRMQIVLYILSGLLVCLPADAVFDDSGFESLTMSADFLEIQEIEVEIREWLERIIPEENMSNAIEIKVDYNQACKIYVDSEIMKQGVHTLTEAFEYLQELDYIWEIPVTCNGQLYIVTLGRGLPLRAGAEEALTEEQIEKINNEVGRWGINSVTDDKNVKDFRTKSMDSLAQSPQVQTDRIIFFGGESAVRSVMAILIADDAMEYVLPFGSIEVQDQRQVNAFSAEELTFKAGVIYDFESVEKVLSQAVAEEGVFAGGGSALIIPNTAAQNTVGGMQIAFIAAGISVIGVIVALKRKYNRAHK